jgi:hypothetical protein
MSSLTTAAVFFGCLVAGTAAGMALRRRLSDEHLSADSKDVVKTAMGLVATMSALVLGLMVASAKSTYDTQRAGVAQLAGNVLFLDRQLARYGPEAVPARAAVRASLADLHWRTWPDEAADLPPAPPGDAPNRYEVIYDLIENLRPETDAQRNLQTQALKTAADIGQARLLLAAQKGRSIPLPFLVVVAAWVTLLFTSFGLYAPRNAVTLTAQVVAALAVAAAMFLILEMDQPFDGVLRVPSTPIRAALEQLGH